MFFDSIRPWTKVWSSFSKTPDQDNPSAQKIQELLKNRPPAQATPARRRLGGYTAEDPYSETQNATRATLPSEDTAPKLRKLNRRDLETLIKEPYHVVKKADVKPPVSMTTIKSWTTNLKKNLPRIWTTTWQRSSRPWRTTRSHSSKRWLPAGPSSHCDTRSALATPGNPPPSH